MPILSKKFFLALHGNSLALISKEKEGISIVRLSNFTPDVKPLYMLRSILQDKKFEIVSGLDTNEVLLRNISLKLKSKREIFSALPFQVEELLPFPPDQTILLPTLYPLKEKTEVSLFATSKGALKTHLSDASNIGIDPDIVSAAPVALFRFVTHYFSNVPSMIAFHRGTFIVISEGRLVTSQSVKEADFARILAYTQKKFPKIEHFFSFQNEQLPITFTKLELPDADLEEYAFAIGLALDAAKGDQQSCQFRTKGMLSKNQQEKRKRNALNYWASCGLFVLVSLGINHLHLQRRNQTVLSAIEAKEGQNIKEAIAELENSVYREKKEMLPLCPLPKVHEVLTFLSTHPSLSEGSINHVRYEIVKMPRLGTQVKTFTGKVDVELTCETPSTARGFHRALLNDDRFIDHRQDVRWSGDHGIYRATFHLKTQGMK